MARQPDYSDLDLDFQPHPVTGDVRRKLGVEAVRRSVRNLVSTGFYERPFRSYIGTNVRRMLFEPATPMTATLLKQEIELAIANFEPRAQLLSVEVVMDTDGNGYTASILFRVLGSPEPILTTIFLERIR